MDIFVNGKLHKTKISTGCYEIGSINTVLQKQLLALTGEKEAEQHVVLCANLNTLKYILEIKDEKTVVDFNIELFLDLMQRGIAALEIMKVKISLIF